MSCWGLVVMVLDPLCDRLQAVRIKGRERQVDQPLARYTGVTSINDGGAWSECMPREST